MAPITNQMLNAKREADCVGLTTERKYFKVGHTWIKRSLRPAEWQINPFTGTLVVPRFGAERILNEAAAMQFIAEKTSIPVPKLHACFQDDEAAYLVMEYVDGVTMNELNANERQIVERELEGYLQTLRTLKSDSWGGPSGIVSLDIPDAGAPRRSNLTFDAGYSTVSCHGQTTAPELEDEAEIVRGSCVLP